MDPHTPTELKLNLFPAPRIQRRPSSWDPSQPLPVHQFYQLQAYSKMPGPERTSPTARPVVQPPRPPNAWIIFRSEMSRILPPVAPGQPGRPQSAVSRTIADLWANLDPKTKQQYERRAEAKKAEHALKYPNYRFTPVKKEEKERIREEKRLIKEAQTKGQSRRGRAKPPTNASSSSSNPYMMMPVPMTSYYPPPPQLFPSVPNYGPLGPSPPVSAASSPNDSGLYSESSHSSPSADLSQSQVPAALPYSAMMTMMTPQSSGMGASVSPPSQSQSQSPQPGPSHWAPQQEDNASSSSLVPDWSILAPSQAGYMSSQPSTPADTQVSLTNALPMYPLLTIVSNKVRAIQHPAAYGRTIMDANKHGRVLIRRVFDRVPVADRRPQHLPAFQSRPRELGRQPFRRNRGLTRR